VQVLDDQRHAAQAAERVRALPDVQQALRQRLAEARRSLDAIASESIGRAGGMLAALPAADC
jgi:hypothetical protein